MDFGDAGLVQHDLTRGAELPVARFQTRLFETHADELLLILRHLERPLRIVDGLKIVPCFCIYSGIGRSIFVVGGVAIVECFSPCGRRCCSASVLINRFELHPAIGRNTGLIRFVGGMHRVYVIKDFSTRFLWCRIAGEPSGEKCGSEQDDHCRDCDPFHFVTSPIPAISSTRLTATSSSMVCSWYINSASTMAM